MGNVTTGNDQVRVYLTGANESGGIQRDARYSLGKFRSRTRADSMTWHRFDAIAGLLVDYVSGTNGPGLGILETRNGNELRWTPPRGTAGAWVTVDDANPVVVAGSKSTYTAFLIVRRYLDDNGIITLAGSERLQIMDTVDNVFGQDLFWLDEYRAVMVRNEGSTTVTNVYIAHLDQDGIDNDTWVMIETPVNGELQEAGGGSPPPSGTFLTLTTQRLIAASLAPGEEKGLWLWRNLSGAAATPYTLAGHELRWVYGGTTFREHLRGARRIRDLTLKQYVVFVGQDEDADIESTPAFEFNAADLPYATTALAAGHTYDIRVHSQNHYALRDLVGQRIQFELDGDGELMNAPPTAPSRVRVDPDGAGEIRVRALYQPELEEDLTLRASRWAVWVGLGETPDPDVDTPAATVTMNGSGRQWEQLDWTSDAEYLEDTPLEVIIRTQRLDGTEWIDSADSDVVSATVEWKAVARPRGAVSIGFEMGIHQAPPAVNEIEYIDEAKNVYWEVLAGETRLWADAVLVWNAKYDEGIFTTFAFQEADVSTAQTAVVEIGTWDGGAKEIHFAVNGTRRMTVDVVAGTVKCAGLNDVLAVDGSFVDSPLWAKWAATCLQVYAESEEQYRTAASLDEDGVLRLAVPWIQRLSQEDCL